MNVKIPEKCPMCRGTGSVIWTENGYRSSGEVGVEGEIEECDSCNGSGVKL